MPQTLSAKDYEVYSSVLSTLFAKHPPLQILDRTGYAWQWNEELGPHFGPMPVRMVLNRHPELASEFKAVNAEPAQVESKFATPVEHAVVTSAEGVSGWQLSRIGFSADGTFAVLMVQFTGRPTVSNGILVLCERKNDAWQCEKIGEWCS